MNVRHRSINSLPAIFALRAYLMPSLDRLSAAIIPSGLPSATSCKVSKLPILSTTRATSSALTDSLLQHSSTGTAGHSINGSASAHSALVDIRVAPHGDAHCGLPEGVAIMLQDAVLTPLAMPTSSKVTDESSSSSLSDAVADCTGVANTWEGDTAAAQFSQSSAEVGRYSASVFDLNVKRGELLVICGTVGSGKSTLLAALAGARPLTAGTVLHFGSRAYVSQPPFLMRDTVRNNITFCLPYDTRRYEQAVRDAALETDVLVLSNGHETNVGEGGVLLSGGQRARVAFARALYANAEIFLLEDIFAAVDANTGRQLWRTLCQLLADGKTLVLVTNQAHIFSRPEVGRICIVSNGRLAALGRFAEVSSHLEALGLAVNANESASAPAATRAAEESGVPVQAVPIVVGRADEDTLLSLRAAIAVVRRTLKRSQGEVVSGRLIDRTCAALKGSCGFGLDDEKREGLVSSTWKDSCPCAVRCPLRSPSPLATHGSPLRMSFRNSLFTALLYSAAPVG